MKAKGIFFDPFRPKYYPIGRVILAQKKEKFSQKRIKTIETVNKMVVKEWLAFGNWGKHIQNLFLHTKTGDLLKSYAHLHSIYLKSCETCQIEKAAYGLNGGSGNNRNRASDDLHLYSYVVWAFNEIHNRKHRHETVRFLKWFSCGFAGWFIMQNLNISVVDKAIELINFKVDVDHFSWSV